MSADPPENSAALALAPPLARAWDGMRWQKLWLATQRRDWQSLAVLAGGDGVETMEIAELLARVAWAYRGRPSCVFDLRDLSLRLADYQLREVEAQVAAGNRVFIALRAASENPTAIPIARKADAVVLCVRLGQTQFKSVERTIAEVGRDRILGSIVVRDPKAPVRGPKASR